MFNFNLSVKIYRSIAQMKTYLIILTLMFPVWALAQTNGKQVTEEDVDSCEQAFLDSLKQIYNRAYLLQLDSIIYSRETAKKLQTEFEEQLSATLTEAFQDVEKQYLKMQEAIVKAESKAKTKQEKEEKKEQTVDKAIEETKVIPEVVVETAESPRDKFSYTETDWAQKERILNGVDSLPHVRNLVNHLMVADSVVENYYSILDEFSLLAERISKFDAESGKRLSKFVKDIVSVKQAQETLRKPYNKEGRNKAQEGLKNVSSLSDEQQKTCKLDDLKEGLRLYFLTTSNMLDVIEEIESACNLYISPEVSEDDKKKAAESIKESISFEARVANFRLVPYMNELFEEICNKVIVTDDDGNLRFEDFDMTRLNQIKDDLLIVRQS
jgi:hypothetical protein